MSGHENIITKGYYLHINGSPYLIWQDFATTGKTVDLYVEVMLLFPPPYSTFYVDFLINDGHKKLFTQPIHTELCRKVVA